MNTVVSTSNNPVTIVCMSEAAGTSLGRYIRARRRDLGLTQDAVAEVAGVDRAHISQIETGKINLPDAELRRGIATALRVRHVDLLVAAGELRADEIELPPLPLNPFPEDDARHQVIDALLRGDPKVLNLLELIMQFTRPSLPTDPVEAAG